MYRIVVASEEDEEPETKLKLRVAELDGARRRKLEAILKEFVNVLAAQPRPYTTLTWVRHSLFILYLTVYVLLGGNNSETNLTNF